MNIFIIMIMNTDIAMNMGMDRDALKVHLHKIFVSDFFKSEYLFL